MVLDNWSDLANHPYCLILDIKELHPKTKKPIRETRVVNIYDNYIGQRYIQQEYTTLVQRTIQNISWSNILRSRVLLLGDMNTHSTSWNLYCVKQQNAGPLKEFIDKYKLILYNNTEFPTCPQSPGIFIIDLALTMVALRPLTLWEIPEKYSSVSDHELIILQWEDQTKITLSQE